MNPSFLLDTNIVSQIIKAPSKADRKLRKLTLDEWCISAVTRGELRFGLALRPEATSLRLRVEELLSNCRTAAWDERAADCFGQVRAELRGIGQTIGFADEMIAAHALALNCTLVTNNEKHFSRVPGLRVENWLR